MARLIARGAALAAATASLAGCDPRIDYTDVPVAIALSSTDVTPTAILGGSPIVTPITIIAATPGNAGGLAVTIQYSGGATGWLGAVLDRTTVAPDQPATLSLTATPGSLPLGVYPATVRIVTPDAANAPINVSVRLTIDPRPPTRLAVATEPGGPAVNGQPLPQQPSVQLFNDRNEPATVANVVVTASIAGGGGQLIGSATTTTNGNGLATFSGLGILGTIGQRTIRFSAPGLTPVDASPVTLLAGAATTMVALTPLTQSVNAGNPVPAPPRVRVVDQSGNGVAGFAIAFAATAGSAIVPAAPVVSGGDGSAGLTSWTVNPVAGANTVTASGAGLAGSPIAFTATGLVGPAALFTKVSGDNLIGLVGTQLGTPHVVKVSDAAGNGVSGATINWSVTGGGSISPTSSITDQNGLAQATRTLGAAPGPATTTASTTVNGPVQLSFAITAALAGPATITKVAGDGQTGVVGALLPTQIRVRVLDAVDVPQPNVTVTFTTSSPGAVLTGGGAIPGGVTVVTDGGGFASATWRLGTTAGTQTVQAAVGGPAPAVFAATATPGPVSGAISTVAANPSTITAGGQSTITVTARDANGNPVPGQNVTLAVLGASTLAPLAGITGASGAFSATLSATVSGAKVVSASIGGTPVTQTATVTVTAAAPSALVAVSSQSLTGLRFGQAVSTPPSVRVLDQFGNGVPNITVTFGITSGQSSVAPSITATNAGGTATVSSWIIASLFSGPAESDVYNRLVASSGALPALTFTGTVQVSHSADLMTVYAGCTGGACHSGNNPLLNGSSSTVWSILRAGSGANTFRYVIPGDSTSSSSTTNLLWLRPTLSAHGGGIQYSARLRTIVKAWIAQGALQN